MIVLAEYYSPQPAFVTVHYTPSLRGDALAEVVFQALTENCSARYVVNQFLTSGTGFLDPTSPRAIRVFRAADHRVPYTHTVTAFPGGRAVSTDEAVHDATAHATRYGLDTSTLTVEVQTFPMLLDEHRRLAPAGDEHA